MQHLANNVIKCNPIVLDVSIYASISIIPSLKGTQPTNNVGHYRDKQLFSIFHIHYQYLNQTTHLCHQFKSALIEHAKCDDAMSENRGSYVGMCKLSLFVLS